MDAAAALSAFLSASAEIEADVWLGRLITEWADPVILRALGAGPAGPGTRGGDQLDAEDMASHARERLIARLRGLREDQHPEPINDFAAYAATTALSSRAAFLRKKHPRRAMLANQVRYLLENHGPQKAFDLRPAADGRLLAALRDWPADRAPVRADPEGWRALPAETDWAAMPLARVIERVIEHAGAPLEIECLVNWLAHLRGVTDQQVSADDPDISVRTHVEAALRTDDDTAGTVDWRHYLTALWAQVQTLSVRQRTAFLLHFDELLEMERLRIASQTEVARALEMPAAALAALWNDIPVEDNRIAGLLGATRQQVINLRMVARGKLRGWAAEMLKV